MEMKSIVGGNIRKMREAMNLNQSQLARKIGMDPSYLGRLERGEKSMRSDTLLRVAQGLGVNTDRLYYLDVSATCDGCDVVGSILALALDVEKLPEERQSIALCLFRSTLEVLRLT